MAESLIMCVSIPVTGLRFSFYALFFASPLFSPLFALSLSSLLYFRCESGGRSALVAHSKPVESSPKARTLNGESSESREESQVERNREK